MLSRRTFLKFCAAGAAASLLPPAVLRAQQPRTWTVTGTAGQGLGGFDTVMQTYMQQRSIRSGTLAISYDGRLVFARGYGWSPSTEDTPQPYTRFRIASISKPITDLAIHKLVADSQLNYNDLLVNLVSLPSPADSRVNTITVNHLLQHTGGWDINLLNFDPMFRDYDVANYHGVQMPVSQQQVASYMLTQYNLNHTPGTTYAYSNFGYMLLGLIVEAVSGLTYENYVQREIMNPVGVRRSELGYSLRARRLRDEVIYYDTYDTLGGCVVAPISGGVPVQYGGFNLENMSAHGGWISSAVDLARLPLFSATGSGSWTFFGSLPGTLTVSRLRSAGGRPVRYAALFNQRNDPSGLDYFVIDNRIDNLLNTLGSGDFPNIDLFDQYL